MSQSSSGEKTEKPTPKRKEKARKDGQIARTADLGAWLTVLAATWLIPWAVQAGGAQMGQMLRAVDEVPAMGADALTGFLGDAVLRGSLVMAPMVLAALVIGVLTQVVQIGWAPKKVKADLKKLDVIKGVKGLFGMRLLWESVKNVVKLVVVVVLGIAPLQLSWYALVNHGSGMNVPAMGAMVADHAIGYLRAASAVGLVLAAVDYWQNKKRVDKQIKMTKHEVKQEHKNTEGDPLIKGQIRQRQMAMSRNRMMAEIPNADAVIVNPTHIAVALRYDPLVGAPVVVAKGAGAIADRIRELAGEHDVPIIRDVPLARTVFRLVEVGHQVPAELYEAIARVLAFVFAMRAKGRRGGVHDRPFGSAHEDLAELSLPRQRGRRRAAA